MTPQQKRIVEELLKGRFLMMTKNHAGSTVYKIYTKDMSPVRYIHRTGYKAVKDLLKKDKRGRYTLNLNLVRQLHGKSWIKQQYYLSKSNQTNGQNKK